MIYERLVFGYIRTLLPVRGAAASDEDGFQIICLTVVWSVGAVCIVSPELVLCRP